MEPKQTERNQLTRKQKGAIPHLIAARSFEEGRKNAQVAKTTLYRWLKEEKFRNELERRSTEVVSEALAHTRTEADAGGPA